VLEEDLESREERKNSFFGIILSILHYTSEEYLLPQIIGPTDRELFNAETEIIKRIAKERSAVIIGRCSTHIFCGHPNHVSIFLHGNIKFRNGRVQELYHVSKETAGKMIAQSDKERAIYYRTFTGKEWTDLDSMTSVSIQAK